MKKIVYVHVVGTAGSGKTTLAEAIADLCRKNGVEVALDDADETPAFTRKLANLSGKTGVVIKTTQAIRHSL